MADVRSLPPASVLNDEIVGRQRERTLLREAFARADAGSGGLVCISGDHGIGKTSLAVEVAGMAANLGALVAWGRCWESGGAPAYWPWTQVVRSIVDQQSSDQRLNVSLPSLHAVATLAPDLHEVRRGEPVEGLDQDRFGLFESTTAFLREVAHDQTLLIVLDDIHSGDEPSLQLLHFVARFLIGQRMMIVATFVETDGARTSPPSVLNAAAREGVRLTLSGLSREEIASIYRRMTDDDPSEAVLSAIAAASEGNPFFVTEAIKLLASEGDLRRPDHSLGFRVPNAVRDLVRNRIEPLEARCKDVLSTAAVLGRDFSTDVLEGMSGLTGDVLESLLAEAVDHGVLRSVGIFGQYSFSHILIRETLYESMTSADRMRLHALAAVILEERHRDQLSEHIAELAHHHFKSAQAGDRKKTLYFSVRAADQARDQTAYEEAARLYRRALTVADLTSISSTRREGLREQLRASELRAAASGATLETVEPVDPQGYVFTREGEFWTVVYEGTTIRLRDSKGMRYLSLLLASPGQEIHALELVAAVEGAVRPDRPVFPRGSEPKGTSESGVEILDPIAKAQYRRRLEDLQSDLDEAATNNDFERQSRAQEEMDMIIHQLTSAVGLGGRDRRSGSPPERARLSVTKATRNAVRRIGREDRGLAAHLENAIRTGIFCAYEPDPRLPVHWEI